MDKNKPLKYKPKAVIFDLSSTLINSQEVDREALNYVLSLYEKPPWSEMRKQRDKKKSIKENFPNFFGKMANEAYKTYINYLLANKKRMPLFDGALKTLQQLKDNNIKVIIISNRDKSFVKSTIKELGIEEYISLAIGAGDTPYSKPSKKLVEFALNGVNITNTGEDILFVGDALADIDCADASDTLPILMRMCQTDITDNWIKTRQQNKKGLRIFKDHKKFQQFITNSIANDKKYHTKRFPDGFKK